MPIDQLLKQDSNRSSSLLSVLDPAPEMRLLRPTIPAILVGHVVASRNGLARTAQQCLILHTTILLAIFLSHVAAVNNGLAKLPQMGWNNWNALGCEVSESLLLDTAQIIVDTGLRDVGYNYVVLDDCWSGGRGDDDYLYADEKKFPRGMAFVADRVHELGLLYGMYSSAGEMTCARDVGSLDFEKQDAQTFAKWGVDYLKYDNCFNRGRFGTPLISFQRYEVMWNAINATGRPIFYSLCNWGEDSTHAWANGISNSWRMSGDIYDFFTRPDDLCSCGDVTNPACIAPGKHCSVLNIINRIAPYADRSKPGSWADMDMLEVGNGGMTDDEYRAHFSMWAALNSPLLMGNDLRTISASAFTILNNPAVIAINQDPLAKSAIRVLRDTNVAKDKYGMGETQVWSGKLHGGDRVVVMLNAAAEDIEMSVTLEEIFLQETGKPPQVGESWTVFDLWGNRMDEKLAQQILNSPASAPKIFQDINWYNSTALSYEKGVKKGDERLLGKKIAVIEAYGTLSASVKSHSAEMYRLRNLRQDTSDEDVLRDDIDMDKSRKKDEL